MAKKTQDTSSFPFVRKEARLPMAVGVHIAGHQKMPGVETTFTQNVSSHGARVLSVRRWRTGDSIEITTLTGAFRSLARVAYCETERSAGFVIGIEFLDPSGTWITSSSVGSTEVQLR
jgi:hypothetical protein